MKSSLDIFEFKQRLADSVTPEKDVHFFADYDFSGVPFCGSFDHHSFDLTTNSLLIHSKGFRIKGTYMESPTNKTDVDYQVTWSPFARTALYSVGALAFVGTNAVLLMLRNRMELPFTTTFVTVNTFFAAAWVLGVVVGHTTRRMIDRRFRRTFELKVQGDQ